MFERLQDRVNADARLVRRGRLVDAVVLVGAGEERFRLTFRAGRIEAVEKGPFVMPGCTFALHAEAEDWDRFAEARPAPGYHDLFALLKRRKLRIEGNLHPFMANLFYFKAVFAALRPEGA